VQPAGKEFFEQIFFWPEKKWLYVKIQKGKNVVDIGFIDSQWLTPFLHYEGIFVLGCRS